MKTIGMIVAMEEEVLPLLKNAGKEGAGGKEGCFSVHTFYIGANKIVCVKSGVGEIYAAAATQMLLDKYCVDIVINYGVCGSLTDELAVKGLAVVKGVVHYDFDTSALDGCEVGRYPEFPSVVLPTDDGLRKKALTVIPGLKEVVCASADKFVADEGKKRHLNETYGAEICEMESAGVLLTCLHAGVPCLILKAVSDGKGGAEEFTRMVNESAMECAKIVTEVSAVL